MEYIGKVNNNPDNLSVVKIGTKYYIVSVNDINDDTTKLRSVMVNKDLKAGDKITMNDLEIKPTIKVVMTADIPLEILPKRGGKRPGAGRKTSNVVKKRFSRTCTEIEIVKMSKYFKTIKNEGNLYIDVLQSATGLFISVLQTDINKNTKYQMDENCGKCEKIETYYDGNLVINYNYNPTIGLLEIIKFMSQPAVVTIMELEELSDKEMDMINNAENYRKRSELK